MINAGHSYADLVDPSRREVSMRVLTDPSVYELEMEQIFSRSWLFVAHESEIPRAGDYVLRRMGSDQVVVVRQADGTIAVMLNMCRHRGMQVCRTDMGNARRFVCHYHGWAYGPDGAFLGAPVASERMQGDIMTTEELGMARARVSLFHGLVFAAWRPSSAGLADELGEIGDYFRMMVGRRSSGLEVLGPPQRALITANWKCAAEQAAGDDFHSRTLHRSLIDMLAAAMPPEAGDKMRAAREGAERNRHVEASVVRGHSVMCFPRDGFDVSLGRAIGQEPTLDRLRRVPPPGMSPVMVDEMFERFDPGALDIMAYCPPQTGAIFPSFNMVQAPYPTGSFTCFHAYNPMGPDHFEFLTWILTEKDADEDSKAATAKLSVSLFGPSGVVEQDDSDVWPAIQRAAHGFMGSRDTLKYQAFLGPSKPPEWPGGGDVYGGFSKDDNQWAFWLRWREMMAASGGDQ